MKYSAFFLRDFLPAAQ